jgi:hypothetical protein
MASIDQVVMEEMKEHMSKMSSRKVHFMDRVYELKTSI